MWQLIEQAAIFFIANHPWLFLALIIVALVTTAFPEVWKNDKRRLKKFFY